MTLFLIFLFLSKQCNSALHSEEFCQSYTQYQTNTGACTGFNNFIASIPSNVETIWVGSSLSSKYQYSCSSSSIAQQIVSRMKTTTLDAISCNGLIWHTTLSSASAICVATATGYTCNSCDVPYAFRPCLNNNNWGGTSSNTCSAPSQQLCFGYSAPTKSPTKIPTINPTKKTKYPSKIPTKQPTKYPTLIPTKQPSIQPTKNPSIYPTITPTKSPTIIPTKQPSINPTILPTKNPSKIPTKLPSNTPLIYTTRDINADKFNIFNENNKSILIIIFSCVGFIVLILFLCLCYFCLIKLKRDDQLLKMQTELATLRMQSQIASTSHVLSQSGNSSRNIMNMHSMPNVYGNNQYNNGIGMNMNIHSMPNVNNYQNNNNNNYGDAGYYPDNMDTYNSAVLGEGGNDNNALPDSNNNPGVNVNKLPPVPIINEDINNTGGYDNDDYDNGGNGQNQEDLYYDEEEDNPDVLDDDGYQETAY